MVNKISIRHERLQTRSPTFYSHSDSADNNYLSAIASVFLAFNAVLALDRAHAKGYKPMMAFIFFLYLGFLTLFWLLKASDRLTRHEELLKKNRMKACVWILATSLNFGVALRVAPLLPVIASGFIFAAATASSLCGLFFFLFDP